MNGFPEPFEAVVVGASGGFFAWDGQEIAF